MQILSELPHHAIDPYKPILKDLVEKLIEEQTLTRCCDRRRMLLIMTDRLYCNIDGRIFRLLSTLSEIQRILYLDDNHRTAKEILRLHNSAFEHFTLMRDIFDTSNLSKGMSRDKLYGKYLHNLLVHSPI